MDASHYNDLVAPMMATRWVLPGVPLAAVTPFLDELERFDAPKPFIIANGLGTGPLPDEDRADWVVLEVNAANIMEEIRLTARLLDDLPAHVLEAVDAWDPHREARVLGNPFVTASAIAGRRVVGGRPPTFEELEDKMFADAIWDAAGVDRAPSKTVSAGKENLVAAHRALDRGRGTVWSGDTYEGFNGGAEYVRWVEGTEDIDEAAPFFAQRCRRVRVMPFLEGIPCSIHAVVFPTETVALRPCEMITLRPATGRKLRYCGTATYWDPAPNDTDHMRRIGEQVGEWLRANHDYRGTLTIDGVMTEDGFLPTELNSRPGGAIHGVVGAVEGLPFGMIQRALIERIPFDYRPREFQQMVLEASENERSGRGLFPVDRTIRETTTTFLSLNGESLTPVAEEPDANAGTIELGPSSMGGLVFYKAKGSDAPIGPSFAPRAAAAFLLADDRWDLGIGDLDWAHPVR